MPRPYKYRRDALNEMIENPNAIRAWVDQFQRVRTARLIEIAEATPIPDGEKRPIIRRASIAFGVTDSDRAIAAS